MTHPVLLSWPPQPPPRTHTPSLTVTQNDKRGSFCGTSLDFTAADASSPELFHPVAVRLLQKESNDVPEAHDTLPDFFFFWGSGGVVAQMAKKKKKRQNLVVLDVHKRPMDKNSENFRNFEDDHLAA